MSTSSTPQEGREREHALIPHYNANVIYGTPLNHQTGPSLAAEVQAPMADPVLDLGCGNGILSSQLSPDSAYLGVDYSSERIATARARPRETTTRMFECADLWEWIDNQSRCSFRWGTVALFDVLEHLHDPRALVDEIRRCLDFKVAVGTVPIRFPYVAHLSVWQSVQEAFLALGADAYTEKSIGGMPYAVLRWDPRS